jgi:hypothetical protein
VSDFAWLCKMLALEGERGEIVPGGAAGGVRTPERAKRAVVRVLMKGPLKAPEIADRTRLASGAVDDYLRALIDEGRVRITYVDSDPFERFALVGAPLVEGC